MELAASSSQPIFRNGVVQYTNNILHRSQSHPNRQGRSYTNYHFDPTDARSKQRNLPNVLYVQTTQEPTNTEFRYLPTDEPKLFNVGYTIRFANNPTQQAGQTKRSRQLDDDVVMGSQGAEMPRPVAREEIILNEFLDNKKRKLSGIKPKYYRPLSHGLDTKYLLAQANLSPATQKKLEELQSGEQTTQDRMANARWRSLSPSVEIYRSDNIYANQQEQYKKFDHARALQKSILFDHTNAIAVEDAVRVTPKPVQSYLTYQ